MATADLLSAGGCWRVLASAGSGLCTRVYHESATGGGSARRSLPAATGSAREEPQQVVAGEHTDRVPAGDHHQRVGVMQGGAGGLEVLPHADQRQGWPHVPVHPVRELSATGEDRVERD